MKKKNVKAAFCGAAVGAVNGLFGGGGGMVAVPLLTDVLGYGAKQAHATAICVIAPVCLVSLASYLFNGYIDLSVVIPAAIGNIAGGLLGARLLGKIPETALKIMFFAIMITAGIRMIAG